MRRELEVAGRTGAWRPGPGGFVLGIGLEMHGVFVAVGCIVCELISGR